MEITVAAAIIAVVKQLKDSFPNIQGIVTMFVAAVLGGLAGYFHVQGLTSIISGILLGIAAVGTMTVATRISTKAE